MKLKLTNIGCWKKNEFEFNDAGLNLLSGQSGIGKSTCLRAIAFALFGIGTKIITDGCTSGSVELEYGELHVIRSKGPCRLVVNHSLEDDEAQSFINEFLQIGDISTIYLEQNGKNTFVNMTPQQKLEFLERITFSNSKLKLIKEKLADKTKGIEYKRLDLNTRLTVIDEKLSTIQKPIISSTVPQNLFEQSKQIGVDAMEINLNEKITSSYDKISELDQKINVIRTYQQAFHEFQTCRINKSTEIERLQVNLEKYDGQETFDSTILPKLYEQLDNIRVHTELIQSEENHAKCKSIYDELVSQKKDAIEKKLNDLVDEQKSIPHTRKELRQLIKDFRLSEQLQDSIAQVKGLLQEAVNIDELKKLQLEQKHLQELISQKTQLAKSYPCPVCKSFLQLDNNQLTPVDNKIPVDELKAQIKTLNSQIVQITSAITTIQTLQNKNALLGEQLEQHETDLDQLNVDTIDIVLVEEQYESINRIKYAIKEAEGDLSQITDQFNGMEREISTLDKKCLELRKKCADIPLPTKSRAQVEKELIDATRLKAQWEEIDKIYQSTLDQLKTVRQELDELNTFKIQTFTYSLEELENMRKKCEGIISSTIEDKTHLHRIREFLLAEMEFNKLYQQKQELTLQSELEKESFSACVDFKKILSRAESIAIKATIDTINIHAQHFIDAFFIDEPMSAQITTLKSKGTKTEREQLNIEIIYKGMNIDLKMLSGGEYDRVVLAFMMSVMDMDQSPILLLDECISSLDQETADTVCTYIQSHSKNRCVILIAHQIVSGMFDSVIHLKK